MLVAKHRFWQDRLVSRDLTRLGRLAETRSNGVMSAARPSRASSPLESFYMRMLLLKTGQDQRSRSNPVRVVSLRNCRLGLTDRFVSGGLASAPPRYV